MVAEPIPFKARIPVHVCAADPLSRAGITSQLRRAQGFGVVDGELPDDVVALVVAEDLDSATLGEMRSLRGRGVRRILLLVSRVDDRGLLAAAEAGVTGVLRRSEATAGNLAAAIRSAAAGEGTLPRTCWGGCCGRSGSCSARCCRRAASPSPVSPSAKPPWSGCWRTATTPRRSPGTCSTPSAP